MSRKLDFEKASRGDGVFKHMPDLTIYGREASVTLKRLRNKKPNDYQQKLLLAEWNRLHGLPEDTPI